MSEGRLSAAIKQALKVCGQMREDGASQADIADALEMEVRRVWPFTREWKYLCHRCDDTGWVCEVCRVGDRCNGISTRIDAPNEKPGKYTRLCAIDPTSDYTHDYVRPCECSRGDQFRPKPRAATDELGDVGKTQKPRPMTRWGR